MFNDINGEEENTFISENDSHYNADGIKDSGKIYSNDIPNKYIRVGNIKPDSNSVDNLLMTHPKSEKIGLAEATKVGNMRNHDMIAFKSDDGMNGNAFTGKIDESWINDDICDCDTPKTPSLCNISSNKVQKYDKDKDGLYTLYVNPDNNQFKELINKKLTDCVNKISKDKKHLEHKMGYTQYKKDMDGDPTMGFNEYLHKKKKDEQINKMNEEANKNTETLTLYNNTLQNNNYSLNILKQMNASKDELLNKNSYDINGIDEKILTTSEKINNLKEKYDFNNKIIKLLRTITLWIFIITMFVLCYFGVRDKYIDTIKPTGKTNTKVSK